MIGLVVIGLAAIGITFALAPEPAPQYQSGALARAAALSDAAANATNTSTVYQQIVANGWASKDLLEVISIQLDSMGSASSPVEDPRTQYLLLLGVLAVCWIGITSPGPAAGIARQVAAGVLEGEESAPPDPAWIADELRQAERLRDAGLMSDGEFEAKRAELISRLEVHQQP